MEVQASLEAIGRVYNNFVVDVGFVSIEGPYAYAGRALKEQDDKCRQQQMTSTA